MHILSLFISLSLAMPLSIKAPNADAGDFFVYQNKKNQQLRIQDLVICHAKSELDQNFKQAQYDYLNSDMAKSVIAYKKVIALQWHCDWKKQQHDRIFHSFLKLAQISQNKKDRMQLLFQAKAFSPKSQPNKSIFAPPIINLYNNIHLENYKKTVFLSKSFKEFHAVYRNGKKLGLADGQLTNTDIKARYTFLSTSYLPVTLIATLSEIEKNKIQVEPMVDGTCKNFNISSKIQNLQRPVTVFFSPQCQKQQGFNQQTIASFPNITTPSSDSSLTTSAQPFSKKKSWIRRNYWWVGAAILTSAILIHQNASKSEPQTVVVPTNTFNE